MSSDVRAKMLAQQPIKAAASRVQRTTKVDVVAAAHSRAELTAASQVRGYVKANPQSPSHGVEIASGGSSLTGPTGRSPRWPYPPGSGSPSPKARGRL